MSQSVLWLVCSSQSTDSIVLYFLIHLFVCLYCGCCVFHAGVTRQATGICHHCRCRWVITLPFLVCAMSLWQLHVVCCTSVSRTAALRENQKEFSRLCTNSTSALTNTHVTGKLYLSILIKESAFKLRLFGGQLTSSQRWLDLSGTGYTRCCRYTM